MKKAARVFPQLSQPKVILLSSQRLRQLQTKVHDEGKKEKGSMTREKPNAKMTRREAFRTRRRAHLDGLRYYAVPRYEVFSFRNSFVSPMSVTCWNPASMSCVASSIVFAALQMYSSFCGSASSWVYRRVVFMFLWPSSFCT